MNTHQTNTITRRQALMTIAAGAAGLVSSAVFAKLPSDANTVESAGVMQPESMSNPSNKPFVMYF